MKVIPTKRISILHSIYLLIFAFMLVLNCLTPLNADDFSYSFSLADVSRIHNISQIIPSMAAHRILMNGRVIVHGVVSFFLIFPKIVFNIFNALNSALLLYLFSKYYCDLDELPKSLLTVCGFFLIWNTTPKFSQTFLWLDGSVNYSWVMSTLLIFLLPYANFYLEGKRMSWIKTIAFALLSFVAGTCGESYAPTAVIIAVIFCILSYARRKKFAFELVLGLISASLGFIFLLTAPASSSRVSELTPSYLINNIRTIISLVKAELMPLYILYAVSLCLALQKECNSRRIMVSVVLALGGGISLSAYSIAVNFTYRHLCFATVITILAILILFSELLQSKQKTLPCVCTAFITVVFLFNMCLGCIDICAGYANFLKREAIISEALARQETQVVLEQHIPFTDYGVAFELSPDENHWLNCAVASYYGFDKVIME